MEHNEYIAELEYENQMLRKHYECLIKQYNELQLRQGDGFVEISPDGFKKGATTQTYAITGVVISRQQLS